MTRVVPSLDSSGWLIGVAQRADRLMSYFLVADYSQSTTFLGKISSLPHLLAIHSKDLKALGNAVEQTLLSLFKRNFDDASVSVIIEDIKDDHGKETSKVNLKIMATITDNSVEYSLGRLINSVDSKVVNVVDLRYV